MNLRVQVCAFVFFLSQQLLCLAVSVEVIALAAVDFVAFSGWPNFMQWPAACHKCVFSMFAFELAAVHCRGNKPRRPYGRVGVIRVSEN